MKNLYDYENTQPATADLPCGAFKNESTPGKKDGTDIIAEHIQDIAYPLFQVLQLAGIVPNGELEDGNKKTQFIQALTNLGLFKYSEKVTYNACVMVWRISSGECSIYKSNKEENNADLSDTSSWTKLITIDKRNKINFHVDTNISGGNNNFPVFCFNSGPVDENGEAALLSLNGDIITLHSPSVCTLANGETYTINDDIQFDTSSLESGKEYKFYYNVETGGVEAYLNNIYWQKNTPANWSINDIWIDISVIPRKTYMKKSETEITEVKMVGCGSMTKEV